MTDAERLAEIRARLAATTPGPWFWNSYSDVLGINPNAPDGDDDRTFSVAWISDIPWRDGGGDELRSNEAKGNADLIAHAPADITWLLEKVTTRGGND